MVLFCSILEVLILKDVSRETCAPIFGLKSTSELAFGLSYGQARLTAGDSDNMRRWEREDDISLIEPKLNAYRPNETRNFISDPALQNECLRPSIRKLAEAAGVSERARGGSDCKNLRA